MSDTYDAFDSFDDGTGADDCCCDPVEASEQWTDDWSEEPAPVYEEPLATADVIVIDDAPSVIDLPAAVTEPAPAVAEPAPSAVLSASGPAVESQAPTIAFVGGSDPYGQMTIVDGAGNAVDPGPLQPTTAFVGGSDPYGGMTIVDPSGAEVSAPTSAVIGGPNAFSEASIGYAADMARFDQLTLAQQKAEVFGGTPELWANQPSMSVFPTPGEPVNDTLVRSVLVAEAAEVLARIQDAAARDSD